MSLTEEELAAHDKERLERIRRAASEILSFTAELLSGESFSQSEYKRLLGRLSTDASFIQADVNQVFDLRGWKLK